MKTIAMKTHKLLLAAFVLASTSACYTVNATLPGALRGDVAPEETESLGTVEVKKTNTFMFWGLTSPPPADFFEKELREQVAAKGGDGIVGLTYESEFSIPNYLLGCVTCGIIAPKDFRVSGNVVRIKKAPIAGGSAAAPADAAGGAVPPPPPVTQGY